MTGRGGIMTAGLMISFSCNSNYAASGGDQMLDGIGETALIVRYLLDGTTEDISRNVLHAVLMAGDREATPGFATDERFGSVLNLSGPEGGQYLSLPPNVLSQADAVSITGWVNLGTSTDEGVLVEISRPGTGWVRCTPSGRGASHPLRLSWSTNGETDEAVFAGQGLDPGEWIHLALVFDVSRNRISLYRQGQRTTTVAWSAGNLFDPAADGDIHVRIGGTPNAEDALHAKLHDFRLYNIALKDEEVLRVYAHDATEKIDIAADTKDADQVADSERPLLNAGLAAVADVRMETHVGHQPRLPYYLPGIYRDGRQGASVRVLWPAPQDNSAVQQPGEIEIRGRVPGTAIVAKAIITVKAETEPLHPPTARIADEWLADVFPGYSTAPLTPPSRALQPFPLSAVTLQPDDRGRDSPFMTNRDKFVRGLLASDPHRYLYMFRHAFGQTQPDGAEPLSGWDNQASKLRGHASGHYLTALAQAYAGARDDADKEALREKMMVMTMTLHELAQLSGRPQIEGGPFNADPGAVPPAAGKSGYDSDFSDAGIRTDYWNWGEGYISAYPPDQFIMLEEGATYGRRDNQIWAPYYTLDKILKGLLDVYEVSGLEEALAVAVGMGLWVGTRLRDVPQETLNLMWNRYIAGEYGGMNKVMTRLHAATGDDRFLAAARRFDHVLFFYGDENRSHGLAKNVDTLRGRHANQHIPQIIGAIHLYERSGDPAYYAIAENFWTICRNSYMYSIGGVAGARDPNNCECFTAEPDALYSKGFSPTGQNETCATYNLLKLSRELFMHDPQARYMDYYERALYNQILASVAQHDPGNTYHIPLNPGARKHFGNADMSGYTCCNGTALDSNTKLQDSIYFKAADDSALFVNLFIPSTLDWPARNVKIQQATGFPFSDSTRLTIHGGGTFDLQVRVPQWATNGFHVAINDSVKQVNAEPGRYLSLGRTWKDGDEIEIRMPFSFHLKPLMDQPRIASLFYGPVLLAAMEPEARDTWRPVVLDPLDPGSGIEGDPAQLRFRLGDLHFKPFFDVYTERHSVYLDIHPETETQMQR